MKISGFTLKTKASSLCGGFKEKFQDIKPVVEKKKTPPKPNQTNKPQKPPKTHPTTKPQKGK